MLSSSKFKFSRENIPSLRDDRTCTKTVLHWLETFTHGLSTFTSFVVVAAFLQHCKHHQYSAFDLKLHFKIMRYFHPVNMDVQ